MVVYYPQMNTRGSGRALAIILVAVTLATALFFWNQREMIRQKTQELLSQSGKQTTPKPPEPSRRATPTPTPTPISQTNETSETNLTNKPKTLTQKTLASAKTTTTIICTPVYGMANACAEHAVVDTALDTSIFYNLAGMSYIFGLAAFIKAKKRT